MSRTWTRRNKYMLRIREIAFSLRIKGAASKTENELRKEVNLKLRRMK